MSKIKPVTELSPELADKIWQSIQKQVYDEKVSKTAVLHHLKQLKAQMGKERKKCSIGCAVGIDKCMDIIDKKIEKINKK